MIKVMRVENTSQIAEHLAQAIQKKLKQHLKVLWLVSGGSSIPIAIETARLLWNENQENLFVSLVDDKYVPRDINQTNGRQLLVQGFKLNGGGFQNITEEASSFNTCTLRFKDLLQQKLEWADVAIGQFGLGEGFHTGGIMANTLAAQEYDALAVGYEYEGQPKITVTPGLIEKLDLAFINSLGAAKHMLIQRFLTSDASVNDEPTQALKLAKTTILCTDYRGL